MLPVGVELPDLQVRETPSDAPRSFVPCLSAARKIPQVFEVVVNSRVKSVAYFLQSSARVYNALKEWTAYS